MLSVDVVKSLDKWCKVFNLFFVHIILRAYTSVLCLVQKYYIFDQNGQLWHPESAMIKYQYSLKYLVPPNRIWNTFKQTPYSTVQIQTWTIIHYVYPEKCCHWSKVWHPLKREKSYILGNSNSLDSPSLKKWNSRRVN